MLPCLISHIVNFSWLHVLYIVLLSWGRATLLHFLCCIAKWQIHVQIFVKLWTKGVEGQRISRALLFLGEMIISARDTLLFWRFLNIQSNQFFSVSELATLGSTVPTNSTFSGGPGSEGLIKTLCYLQEQKLNRCLKEVSPEGLLRKLQWEHQT